MADDASVARSGISGLDDVLAGGFPRNRLYVAQGEPGSGKTTLGLQFLLAGVQRGEKALYVTLSETEEELQAVAHSHGWVLSAVPILELIARSPIGDEEDNTLFYPSEIELAETTNVLTNTVERIGPARVVIDSLSEIRLLSQSPMRYRRQIAALKNFFAGRKCTVLILDDNRDPGDTNLQSIAHGILLLEHLAPLFGAERRRLRILKIRGVAFRGGFHDFKIQTGGLAVFPRLVAAEHRKEFDSERISSGLGALDRLLGGGLDRGTTTLLMGPSGTGKSAIAAQYMVAAAKRGEHVAMYTFDEGLGTLFARNEALGLPFRRLAEEGLLSIQQVDPAELSPGEFAQRIRDAVETREVRVCVIDSLNGYFHSMPEEHLLSVQLHELFMYLRQRGVVVILTLVQHGFLGAAIETPIDVSYLADTVVILRYFEAAGRIRKAISVMKKRSGTHENALRELALDESGLRVGEPLKGFQGILTGAPTFTGTATSLLPEADGPRPR
jgi:circadian clock protein KaiC